MKFIIINGPNLNLLGAREEEHYGKLTLNDIENMIKEEFPKDDFEFYQSNIEGELINKIQSAYYFDGLVINPGGYSHTSAAIKDALKLCKIPKVEVHLSNLSDRENMRQNLITASECTGYISGFKEYGYSAALYLIKKILSR